MRAALARLCRPEVYYDLCIIGGGVMAVSRSALVVALGFRIRALLRIRPYCCGDAVYVPGSRPVSLPERYFIIIFS